jgi:hypothetical protein
MGHIGDTETTVTNQPMPSNMSEERKTLLLIASFDHVCNTLVKQVMSGLVTLLPHFSLLLRQIKQKKNITSTFLVTVAPD